MQKRPRLYAVDPPRFEVEGFDVTRNSLVQSFHGWLRAVEAKGDLTMSAPAVVFDNNLRAPSVRASQKPLQLCPPVGPAKHLKADKGLRPRKMTTQDYVSVMLATVREGNSHARWPTDVVAQFLTAEVIRDCSELF